MKSVLISIKPKYVELIASGEKTIEVRKSRPKLETPFKCYIYCTKDKYDVSTVGADKPIIWHGRVIGEFVCDNVIQWNYKRFITMTGTNDTYFPFRDDLKATCLSYEEFANYGKRKTLYGWHISNLVIYDKPKELSKFLKPCNYNGICVSCARATFDNTGSLICKSKLTRPPQSWCCIEENENERN